MTMTEKRLLDDSFVWDAAAQEEAAEAQRKVAGLAPPPIPEELRQEAPPLQEQTRSNVIHILSVLYKVLVMVMVMVSDRGMVELYIHTEKTEKYLC